MASVKKVEIEFPPGTEEYAFYQTGVRGAPALAEKFGKCADVHRAVKYLRGRDLKSVLEIGSGIGRASVYLSKVLGLEDTHLYLLDGDVGRKRAFKTAKASAGTWALDTKFYNSLDAAQLFCKANGFKRVSLLDAETHGPGLCNPVGRHDACYSFKAAGFHWPVKPHLMWMCKALRAGAPVIFEVRNGNSGMWEFTEEQIAAADAHAGYEIVKTPGRREKYPLLVLRRT